MKNKKIIFTLTTVLLIITFTFVPISTGQFMVAASEAYQKVEAGSGSITANEVNLRTGPDTKFDIICKLSKNQKVTVMGKLGDWYAVYVGKSGNVGSVYSHYLKLDKAQSTTGKEDSKISTAAAKTGGDSKKNSTAKADTTISSGTSTAAADTGKKAAPKVDEIKDVSKDEKALLDLVNKERKNEGLEPLQFDAELLKVARLKAKDMKDNNYFNHTSKAYGTPFEMMKKYGIKFSIAGENIAGNQSAEKVVKVWLKESGNNIYNGKFTHTGIGVVDSPTYGKLFVQLFIKK